MENNYLETEKLGKLMRKYAIPCVISMLVAALYNIVDQIFIANASYLGSYGNAANTAVFPMTVVALAIAVTFGDGCCTYVSIRLGAKDRDSAGRGVGSAVISVVWISILLMIIYLVFDEQILKLFGADVNAQTMKLSKEYFFWISIGIPFYMVGQALNPIIRSDGSPKFAMATLLTGAVINIILDPIFIYVFRWGMKGAAIATILGQIVSAIVSALYLLKMKQTPLNRDCFKYRLSLVKKITILGITSFLSQFSIVISMAATLNVVVKYEAYDPIFSQEQYTQIPTAIAGIVSKFFQIIISCSIGIAAGCIPIGGYNIGAGRNDRVIELLKKLMVTELILGLAASIIFLIFPNQLMLIFGSSNESEYYNEFAVWFIRGQLCLLPLACFNKAGFIFLQSIGKSQASSVLSVLREFVFGVGFTILLPILFGGLYAVPFFMPAADTATAILVVIYLRKMVKSLKVPDKAN
ncbi:MAG: MATE family efflux transporter [Ruminococcus sp.]|nr:MATE family efflux transporter [Ruminococcus sp.]